MASVTPISNGTLIADEVQRLLVQPLKQSSTYLSLGMPTFTSPGQPIKIPSLIGVGTATFAGAGSAIAEATVTTSEIELLPSTVWAAKRSIRVSNESLSQAVTNLESNFGSSLITELRRVVDENLWVGDGTSGAPTGMTNFANNIAYGTAVGTAVVDDLYSMVETAQEADLADATLHWAMSPAMLKRVRVMADSTGRALLQPSLADGEPSRILGIPYTRTNHLPDDTLLLFDRAQVAVGIDSTASLFVTPHRYADTGETAIIGTFRADTAPMNAAVVIATGITA